METRQHHWGPGRRWDTAPDPSFPAHLVLAFGGREVLQDAQWRESVRATWPKAVLAGCSTAGEILDTRVLDEGVTCTAVSFDRARVASHVVGVESPAASTEAGRALARALLADDLRHVIVLSDGLHVNGSALVRGFAEHLPESVGITGGLSADGDRFSETLVLLGDCLAPRLVAAIGFYGDGLRIGCGSLGGWDPFGPERLITRSSDNVLFELDGRSALDLYKMYLGDHAAGLPAAALLFPLNVRSSTTDRAVVRTILAVDEAAGSMTFAGDVPEGAYAQLMRANFDRLIDGAAGAARTSATATMSDSAQLALLISCVGRKLVLRQRVEEEVEGVRDVLGPSPTLAGFYSYGEISPFTPTGRCELHNQTMTITTFAER